MAASTVQGVLIAGLACRRSANSCRRCRRTFAPALQPDPSVASGTHTDSPYRPTTNVFRDGRLRLAGVDGKLKGWLLIDCFLGCFC